MSPKSLRRAGIAAFGLALLLATAVGSPARAGERAAEEAFERLVSEREDALRARARRARARPEVRPGATRPLVIYRASADDFRAELSASAARGWLGVLRYSEILYSCEDVEATRCNVTSTRPVAELYRYVNGAWRQ